MWEFLKTMAAGVMTLLAMMAIWIVIAALVQVGWRDALVILLLLGFTYGVGHVARFGISGDD